MGPESGKEAHRVVFCLGEVVSKGSLDEGEGADKGCASVCVVKNKAEGMQIYF